MLADVPPGCGLIEHVLRRIQLHDAVCDREDRHAFGPRRPRIRKGRTALLPSARRPCDDCLTDAVRPCRDSVRFGAAPLIDRVLVLPAGSDCRNLCMPRGPCCNGVPRRELIRPRRWGETGKKSEEHGQKHGGSRDGAAARYLSRPRMLLADVVLRRLQGAPPPIGTAPVLTAYIRIPGRQVVFSGLTRNPRSVVAKHVGVRARIPGEVRCGGRPWCPASR